ncbi:AEC family transporter [Corynebacterium sp. CCM 9204]|uniref:AEC family transporter n=1 Tax=Corynebacterium sp. CCM 9204 TaxID=3057616 RepID=UPI0035266829
MTDVAAGFSMVFGVIAVGALVGRLRVLGENAPQVLNRFVFFVALPALVFGRVAVADWSTIIAAPLAVIVTSGLFVGGGVALIGRLIPGGAGPGAIITGLAGSYCNAANLGLPLAVHILGDATSVVPLLLFQIGFYGPLALTLLEASVGGRALSPLVLAKAAFANPIVIAAVAGGGWNLTGWTIPGPAAAAVTTLAAAAVPVALIAFGMSLAATRILDSDEVPRKVLAVAVVGKNILHPIVAGVLAVVFGLEGHALLTVIVLAALPTAQNVFVYADRYGVTTALARDAAVLSTLFSIPVMVFVSVFFG